MEHCQCAFDPAGPVAAGTTIGGAIICGGCLLEKVDFGESEKAVDAPVAVPATLDDKDVYLALAGSKKIRKSMSTTRLRSVIQQREGARPLLDKHGVEAVLACAQRLYDSGAFKSIERATEMFLTPASQEPVDGISVAPEKEEPTYLSSMAQRKIFVTLETTLEHACYEFIERNLHKTITIVERRTKKAADFRQITDFILSQSETLKQKDIQDVDQILEALGRAVEPMSAEMDTGRLLKMLPEWHRLTVLLGSSSGQKTLDAIRYALEPILMGYLDDKRSNNDQIRTRKEHFAAERKRLVQMEKEEVDALEKKDGKIDKEATAKVIRGMRSAEDTLLEGYVGGDYRELSLE